MSLFFVPGRLFVLSVRQVRRFLPGSLSTLGDVELDRLAFCFESRLPGWPKNADLWKRYPRTHPNSSLQIFSRRVWQPPCLLRSNAAIGVFKDASCLFKDNAS
jgi:hypothetical protein